METNAKILRLTAENIKRLTAVEITPDGNLIVIGGSNGAGKSSVLDSIFYALGGAAGIPSKALRKGTKSGFVRIDLGDILVVRSFTESGGSNLTVTSPQGAVFKSPQALLDKLVGKLSFDPLAFAKDRPESQADTLKRIVGLDFTQQDQERAALYTQRTGINREVASSKAQLGTMQFHTGLPKEEVSIDGIYAEMRQVAEKIRGNYAVRSEVRLKAEAVTTAEFRLKSDGVRVSDLKVRKQNLLAELEGIEADIAKAKESEETYRLGVETAKNVLKVAQAEADALVDPTDDHLKKAVLDAKETNNKIAQNKSRNDIEQTMLAKSKQSDELTAKIEKIDEGRKKAVADSKFPVPGLSFDEDGGVTLDDLPFCQASSSQQLRVSVAIGLALNPKLRVLLVRDGSLLDQDSLKLLGDLAKEHDAQVWLERVSDGKEVTVVIEDGAVQQKEAE